MQRFLFILGSIALFSASAAYADVIADRQALMKDMGKSVGAIAPMLKGEKPFDAAAALAALENLKADAHKMDVNTLFPEGSDPGNSEASPKIWENRDDFIKQVEKFKTDADAAVTANPQDLDALKPAFQQVAANCGSCHQVYRVKKN